MNYRLTILFFFFTPLIFGQTNLVPNPSFEIFTNCPTSMGLIANATGWYSASSSPDYFHVCGLSQCHVPNNGCGFQYPHTGNAYVGLICYCSPSGCDDFREYMQIQLTDTLTPGINYYCEFYVSLADSFRYAINDVGMYFSSNPVSSPSQLVLTYQPQIHHDSLTILNPLLNWYKISGYYLAQGGEKYITIGNFLPDSLTDTILINSHSSLWAYYYIDDVAVYNDTTTGLDEKLNNNQITIFPNPVTNELTIDLTFPDKYNFELYDLLGAKKLSIRLDSGSKTVYLTDLDSGVYVFTIVDSKGDVIKTDKLIIIK